MNPLRQMLAEYVFKGWTLFVKVEVRAKDTGEPTFYEHAISQQSYGSYPGNWSAGKNGLTKHPLDEEDLTFVPWHRVREIRTTDQVVWRSNDPKTIPQDIPFALESGS